MTRPLKHNTAVVHSIKGFDKNLACRGFRFEVGKTYEQSGTIRACDNGFHACTTEQHPLEVFSYYPPAGSRYCLVEQSGEIHTDGQVKIASAKITVSVELSLNDLIVRAVDWVFARANKEKILETATGYCGAASATGHRGAASATGGYGAASATGHRGSASATGHRGSASATGHRGAASATGEKSTAMACGYGGTVSGANGCALFALERDDDYNIISTASGIVGKKGIKPDTQYRCVGGKLVKA